MFLELADMMDPEYLEDLKKSRVFKTPVENQKKKPAQSNKMKDSSDEDDDDEDLEDYEKNAKKRINENQTNEESVSKRDLLPIRSKEGWEKRSVEVNESEEEPTVSDDEQPMETEDNEEDKIQEPVSVINIMAKRRKMIEEHKLEIGSMATNFLEHPEERIFLLERLIRYLNLGQNDATVENTVIKMASASVLEIFKDIIPSYKIADHETQDKTVKLKKDTLKLHKYESALLQCVKRFLVKCERIVSENKTSPLAPHAFQCMVNLLVTHPEFNYTENIIQFAVPYLNR